MMAVFPNPYIVSIYSKRTKDGLNVRRRSESVLCLVLTFVLAGSRVTPANALESACQSQSKDAVVLYAKENALSQQPP